MSVVDTEKKFWNTAPSLQYRADGSILVRCGDCDWSNRPTELSKRVHTPNLSDAMELLGMHYLYTKRHKK